MDDPGTTGLAATPPAIPAPYVATPSEELSLLVAWGAGLFYWAEAGANPMVRSYWDGLHYISAALSVGYANIFHVTALGKAIGAVGMTIGPRPAARARSARARYGFPRGGADADGGAAILPANLDAILAELRRGNGACPPGPW